ncbi:MAG: PEP-CTERM sorting domain-containing protein [Gammaproteobacteria bacterium]|nr:PEP-CTERM sorting domain-containing protein [Gammaproteobacteria bacterium]
MCLSVRGKLITCRNVLAIFFLFFSHASLAAVIPIDLNDFFPDPTVTVSADGSSATLAEDLSAATVVLFNDPDLGDPEVILAGVGTNLLFDFEFVKPNDSGNSVIEFVAFVLDVDSGLSAGAGFEFLTSSAGSGTVLFDLTGLVGDTLGLQFELRTSSTAKVTVSNLRLETAMVTVPEPTVLVLFGLGLLPMVIISRRFGKKNQ